MNLKLITFDNVAHAEVQGYPPLDGNLKTSFKTHFLKEFGIPYSCAQLTLNTYMPNNSLFSLKILVKAVYSRLNVPVSLSLFGLH